MNKLIFIIIIIPFISISCKNIQGITYVLEKVNTCYEGSNQEKVDEKVFYNEKSKILTFFIGEKSTKTSQKWEIPLKKIEAQNVFFENKEFPYIKIITTKNLDIKYYKNDLLNDSLSYFVYPIHDYCFKEKDIEKFIFNLKKELNEQ